MSKFECEVAVVGAGPYGLSVAAHLNRANIETHAFGDTMSFWRKHMPHGMKVRSPPTSTDMADPDGDYTFHAFSAHQSIHPTWPLPLEVYIRYGEWFQKRTTPELDARMIMRIDSLEDGFRLSIDDGSQMTSRRVVVAVGLAGQQYRPAPFSGLASEYVSSSGEHADLSIFCGKRVAVVGRGQSACEYAAFLHSAGADVELISRGGIHWLGSETPVDRLKDPAWRRLLVTRSGVGPFPINWLVESPGTVRRMPSRLREMVTARCLRPGASRWLEPGITGVRVISGRNIVDAKVHKSKILLQFDNGAAEYDHVLLATGYRSDISKLNLFTSDLLNRIRCTDGSPKLSTGFQSSVPGLHFVGSSSVMSYGPLMRFIAGTGYTARHLTQSVVTQRSMRRRIDNGKKAVTTATMSKSHHIRAAGSEL